jgi:hypothetical protein
MNTNEIKPGFFEREPVLTEEHRRVRDELRPEIEVMPDIKLDMMCVGTVFELAARHGNGQTILKLRGLADAFEAMFFDTKGNA